MKSHIAFKGIDGRETKIEYKTLAGPKKKLSYKKYYVFQTCMVIFAR